MSLQKNKKKDIDLELVRLEFCFDRGINIADRIIQLTGDIEEGVTFDFVDAALTEMERENKKSITLKINSPGGSVYEALAVVDRIRESKCHIITKCYGHAMSAASLILAAGNKRYIGKQSWLMHHEISSNFSGSLSAIDEELKQLKREMQQWAIAMSHFSNESVEFWKNAAYKTDFYLNAEECLQVGVIDEVF